MARSPSPFSLHVQGLFSTLYVRSFRARERVSTPYEVFVEAEAAAHDEERPLLGARARLIIPNAAGAGRTFHGVVTSSERRATSGGATRLTLVLEPRFASLRHTRHRRIFHDMTSVDVARQVLGEHAVAHRLRLVDRYPTHTHRIQANESDLAFVQRILFEEGIFYFFDHPPETATDDVDATNLGRSEVLVLCDTSRYYPRLEPDVPLVERAFATDEEVAGDPTTAFDLRVVERARPHAVLVRGRDALRPTAALGDALDRRPASPTATEGGGMEAMIARRSGLIYEAFGSAEDRPRDLPPAARLLGAERIDAAELIGGTLNPDLMPGRVVRIDGGLTRGGEHVVVAVEHHGDAPGDFSASGPPRVPYRNRLVAAPASTELRPTPLAKPRVDGLDVATVVGPPGQEIHTDEHGRVKVRFLWDLESPADDRASGWLRVVQSWAGGGFGSQFLPRVGMEVMVGFVAGDIDRPIVVGCVHNGTSPSPFRLPEEKTVTGLRTRTSPGGGGLHELVLDDAPGKERISLASQGHLSIRAQAEHDFTVLGGASFAMASARTTIGGEERRSIGGDATYDHATSRRTSVGADDVTQVGGAVASVVAGGSTTRIGGSSSLRVARNVDVAVGGGEEGGLAALRVQGPFVTSTKGRTLLRSDHSVHIEVGESRLRIEPTGIYLEAPQVSVAAGRIDLVAQKGASSVSLAGGASMQGGEVVLASKGAQLKLDADAHLDGGLVLLNCGAGPAPGATAGSQTDSGSLTFRLVNPEQAGGGALTVLLLGPNGETVERPLAADGTVTVDGAPGDRWTLLEVRNDAGALDKKKV